MTKLSSEEVKGLQLVEDPIAVIALLIEDYCERQLLIVAQQISGVRIDTG